MLSHTITWGVNLAVLTNLTQYVWHQQMKKTWKRGRHWERFGPVYLVGLSVPLVMADLTRHILDDEHILGPGWAMFRPGCSPDGITCLSVVGWIFTIVCTYSGFICLFVGVLWSADVHKKFAAAVRKNSSARC